MTHWANNNRSTDRSRGTRPVECVIWWLSFPSWAAR